MSEQQKVPAALMNPESAAYLNSTIASAVSEAMKGAMAILGPVLQSVALTPERIQELKAPYIDPQKAARDLRDKKQMRMQVDEQQRNDALKKASCLHRYSTGMEAIQVVHNFVDHQPRGICPICQDWITPKEWRIGPGDEKNPAGKPYVAKPHKDYARVIGIENGQGQPIMHMTPVSVVGQVE